MHASGYSTDLTIHEQVIIVNEGDQVEAGEVVIIMEAMKMETEIRAVNAGVITAIHIKDGDSVTVGQALLSLD